MSANKIISNKKWHKVANEMEATIIKNTEHHFIRSFGKIRDNRIDASLLGLVYPFDIVDPNNIKMKNTIKEIEKKLNINGGLYRYEYDEYDGWMYKNNNDNNHYKKGAGAWPLLNFWISLYYSKIGDKNKAQKYYNWVIDRVENYIPEQIFENNIQVGVTPLCWSHAMFNIASKELGYIK